MLDRYSRYTLGEVAKGTGVALVAFSLLMLLGWWVRMLQEGLGASELVEGALWFMIASCVMVFPAAVVVGVAQQVGRAKEHGELVALEAGGVGWQRPYRWVVLLGAVFGLFLFFAEETVVVYASSRRDAMMRSLAAQILRTTDGRNRLVLIPQAIVFCHDYRGGHARGVVLFGWPKGYDVEATAREATIEVAEDGSMVFLELRGARIWLRTKETADYIECERYVVCRPLQLAHHERPQTVTLPRALQLAGQMKEKAARGNRRAALYHARYLAEAGMRLSLPWGALIAVFFGISVGRLLPRGGPVAALFLLVVLFYIPLMTLLHLGRTGMAGVWLPMGVMVAFDIAFGLFLMRLARRPK